MSSLCQQSHLRAIKKTFLSVRMQKQINKEVGLNGVSSFKPSPIFSILWPVPYLFSTLSIPLSMQCSATQLLSPSNCDKEVPKKVRKISFFLVPPSDGILRQRFWLLVWLSLTQQPERKKRFGGHTKKRNEITPKFYTEAQYDPSPPLVSGSVDFRHF